MTRALAAAVALMLAACGGGTETSSFATNPERSEATPTPAPAPSEAAPAVAASTAPTVPAAGAEPTPAADSVPESLACVTHSDCVLLAGVCGGVEPTNRSHEVDTREGIEMRRTVASCAAPLRPEPPWVARCTAGRCMAIEPP